MMLPWLGVPLEVGAGLKDYSAEETPGTRHCASILSVESLTSFSELQIIILILEKKELNAQDFHSTTQGQGLSKAHVLSLQL